MAARIGVSEGMRVAVLLSLGFGVGMLVWALAALLGLAVLFSVAPGFFWGFKIAGGLFLLWLALKMWRHAKDPMPEGDGGNGARSAFSAFRLGLATQLSNPKPALFFGAVFLGTIPPDASALAVSLLLLVMFLNEICCTLFVSRVFSLPRSRAVYAGMKTTIDRAFGGLLGLMGLRVALG